MSRDLNDLHPIVRIKAEIWLGLCVTEKIPVSIYFTFRSNVEQNALYLIGRRGIVGEKIVTNAKGGESAHNFRAAFDAVPLKQDGSAWWDAPDYVWKRMGKMAEQVGLDWLGDEWGEYLSWDKGHFAEPGWSILREYLLVGTI